MAVTGNCNARSRDDELLTKVLSSAYSLQQQHDRIQSKLPAARFTVILAEVIDTQALIRNRKLHPDTAMHLIASRTEKLIGAAGAAIALLDGEVLDYRVGTGIAANLSGFKSRAQEIISFERLKSDPLAETDMWQEKVLGGLVVANILSAPIYRQNTLVGCLQLFSRHGHFDSDGRFVCELMSGVLSHMIDEVPLAQADAREEQPGALKPEPASPLAQEKRPDAGAQKLTKQTKLEWPGTATRALEDRLRKAAVSVNATDTEAESSQGVDSDEFSRGSARSLEHDADGWEDDAKPFPGLEKPNFRDNEARKDKNPQKASRTGHRPSPSHGSLALALSKSHPPRLMPNPAVMNNNALKDKTQHAARRQETVRDVSQVVRADQNERALPSSVAANDEADIAGRKTWNRMKRMIYPFFVLLFAIVVGIRAGAHNLTLDVIIYVLLVLTTLDLQSRWSKR